MNRRYAILLDGGFVTKRLQERLRRFPDGADYGVELARIKAHEALVHHDLLRTYVYDARPAIGVVTNPFDGTTTNLARSPQAGRSLALQDTLELMPDVALRLGIVVVRGWRIEDRTIRDLATHLRMPGPQDVRIAIQQKGVDLRMGLDIARLSLLHLADVLVVATGDSDMVPAFKFARREGLQVFVDTLRSRGVHRDLIAHADRVL